MTCTSKPIVAVKVKLKVNVNVNVNVNEVAANSALPSDPLSPPAEAATISTLLGGERARVRGSPEIAPSDSRLEGVGTRHR